MAPPISHLPALVLLSCALTGCGVDSTRSLWADRWVGDPPGHHRMVWQAKRVAECGAKGLITPAAATLDVVTDPEVWQGVLIAGVVAVVVVAACGCGGHGGGGHGSPNVTFGGGYGLSSTPENRHQHDHDDDWIHHHQPGSD